MTSDTLPCSRTSWNSLDQLSSSCALQVTQSNRVSQYLTMHRDNAIVCRRLNFSYADQKLFVPLVPIQCEADVFTFTFIKLVKPVRHHTNC